MNNPLHVLRFAVNFVRLVRDPRRVDLVLQLADQTANPEGLRAFLQRPVVVDFLARRPAPLRVSLTEMRAMPEGSLGRAYAGFLDSRGFDLDGLYHSDAGDGSDIAAVKVHMERSHDLWHTVLGFETDTAGELGLQAYTLAQLQSPLAYVILAAGMLGTLFYHREEGPRHMESITRGWQLGRRHHPLFGADWNAMLTWPIEQVRAHLGVTPADVRAAGLADMPAASPAPDLAAAPIAA